MNCVDRMTRNIMISSKKYDKEYEYWMNQLAACGKTSEILYRQTKKDEEKEYTEYKYTFENTITSKVMAFCNQSAYGLLLFLCTGISSLLQIYNGEQNILIGIPPMKGEPDKFYVNSLLGFYMKVDKEATFKQMLSASQKIMKEMYQNQTYPLYHVFQNQNFELYKGEALFHISLMVEGLHEEVEMQGSDLVFSFKSEGSVLSVTVTYNDLLYTQEIVEQICKDLSRYMSFVFIDYNLKLVEMEEKFTDSVKRRDIVQEEILSKEVSEQKDLSDVYEAPSTDKEVEVEKAWEEVLQIKDISIHADFFKLGGDSIKAIRLVALLSNYNVKVKDIYNYSTIKKLANALSESKEVISQESFSGDIPLSPIQLRFFEGKHFNYSHYNQSFFLYRKERFQIETVKAVIEAIMLHHDILRASYVVTQGNITQNVLPLEEDNIQNHYRITQYNMLDCDEEGAEEQVMKIVNEIQSGLNIEEGPLIHLGYFQMKEGDHLLIVIHHLLVDAFSWRIILEDFSKGYQQAISGQEIQLNHKTHSYKQWVDKLKEFADGSELESEQQYWYDLCSKIGIGNSKYESTLKEREDYAIVFSEEETRQLKAKSSELFINIDHILITCLGLAMEEFQGKKNLSIELEGHGRGDIDDSLNITRTVGWFTSVYPVYIDCLDKTDIGASMEKVSEYLSSIPSGGLTYSVLRYLSSKREEEKLRVATDIRFNYLGEFDQSINSDLVSVSEFDLGYTQDKDVPVNYQFDITGILVEEKLRININYISNLYSKEQIAHFGKLIYQSVMRVIQYKETSRRNEKLPEAKYIDGVEPFNDLIYKDCFYNALFPVLTFYKKDINTILVSDVFVYATADDGKSISANYLTEQKIPKLLVATGMKTNRIVHSNDIVSSLKEAISQDKMVIFRVDCFYSSLRKDTYQKEHWPHTLLAYGYNDKKEIVYVLEQSDKNSLDFIEREMNYGEIYEAYNGLKENFILDKQYPSYMELFNNQEEVSTNPDRYIQSLYQYREEKEQGFAILDNFILKFSSIIENEEAFKEVARSYYYSFQNILKAQYAEKFKVSKLFGEKYIGEKAFNEIIKDWRYASNILEKFLLTEKFKQSSLEKVVQKLETARSIEREYYDKMLADSKVD